MTALIARNLVSLSMSRASCLWLAVVICALVVGCSKDESANQVVTTNTITPEAQKQLDATVKAYRELKKLQVATQWVERITPAPKTPPPEQRDQMILAFDREQQKLRIEMRMQEGDRLMQTAALVREGQLLTMWDKVPGAHAQMPIESPLTFEGLLNRLPFCQSGAALSTLALLFSDKPLQILSDNQPAEVSLVNDSVRNWPGLRIRTTAGALVLWIDPATNLAQKLTLVQPVDQNVEVQRIVDIRVDKFNETIEPGAFEMDLSKSVAVESWKELASRMNPSAMLGTPSAPQGPATQPGPAVPSGRALPGAK